MKADNVGVSSHCMWVKRQLWWFITPPTYYWWSFESPTFYSDIYYYYHYYYYYHFRFLFNRFSCLCRVASPKANRGRQLEEVFYRSLSVLSPNQQRGSTYVDISSQFVIIATIITGGQINLTKGRIAAARGQFNPIRQVSALLTPPPIPIQYVFPWAHQSTHSKQHIDRFSRFCRALDCGRPTDHATWSVV